MNGRERFQMSKYDSWRPLFFQSLVLVSICPRRDCPRTEQWPKMSAEFTCPLRHRGELWVP